MSRITENPLIGTRRVISDGASVPESRKQDP
ncbi:hypothetical protein SNOG_04602 [Parastagonospora nodorum SN15]|uniref:Uncharacterized protein n=1 Tax=Phaeosphaeria nodorum (strain SN15 / ATCC MYA-4574 / FGSC 10173) TaxID=321614 RepID=Q0UUG2_PHANO|nr:hypothetical protein SNOG_04602 [Parastagonospora nodorum SN15]EAT88362.1 hypothetical protein SNOG_04602 [Parastagonospora nodorum SN15]